MKKINFTKQKTDNAENIPRNSSIELLKIIGIILIVISHTIPVYGSQSSPSYININYASENFQNLLLCFYKFLGFIGNCIFVVCSSFFLLNSNRVKPQKILLIILDSFIISVAYLIAFSIAGYKFSTFIIIRQIFPIIARQNWFIGVYLILYAIHPLLNKIINAMTKTSLFILNCCIFIIFFILNFVEIIIETSTYYSDFIGFIGIYFFIAYLKNYLTHFRCSTARNVILFAVSLFAFLAYLFLMNLLGLKYSELNGKMLAWLSMGNPFLLFFSISLFNLFSKLNIKSSIINYLSSLSLLIYLIHENPLLANFTLKPKFFEFIYNTYSYQYISLWCLAGAAVTFIASVIIAAFYRQTIQKLMKYLLNLVYPHLNKLGTKITNRVQK